MDFFGIGAMELLLILFMAFIFLGPGKMAETGRLLGKAMRELRKASSELPKLILEEEEVKEPETSIAYRREKPEATKIKEDEKSSEEEGTP